jgi:hypothetical protein
MPFSATPTGCADAPTYLNVTTAPRGAYPRNLCADGRKPPFAAAYALKGLALSRNRAVEASEAGTSRPAFPKPCGGMLP